MLVPVNYGNGFLLFELGSDVFKFAVRVMGSAAESAIEKAGLTKADIDFLVPHQANIRIIDSAVKRLGCPWKR